ncbi:RICIN domain-containing protein [Streptomyces sp. 3213.3]|uniref:RICIN domain-containing protein n=1 Tax=Streptomyces sp. 3213.3 TaxID=1855348 RepID=UPI00190E96C4|nr:RICIN domain-containing protein [Streptomyces sp. 3213.3]
MQQVTPVKPIEWQDDSDAFSLLGDPTWTDYMVKVDVNLQQAGTVELLGRANTQNRPQSHQAAYLLRVSDTGAWSIVRSSAAGTHAWHTLSLGFSGDRITATADGTNLGATDDSSFSAGQIGVGVVGYRTDQFDNLSVTANPPGHHAGIFKGRQSGLCADVPGASRTNGTQLALWDCNGAANQAWTLTPAGQLTGHESGRCVDVPGANQANGTRPALWDCNGGAHQQWRVRCDGSVVNVGSGTCLDAVGHGTANSTALDIWTCTGGANQIWRRS